jgi:hypothetical protein
VVDSVVEPEARPLFTVGERFIATEDAEPVMAMEGLAGTSPSPVTASEALGSQNAEPAIKEREKVKSKIKIGSWRTSAFCHFELMCKPVVALLPEGELRELLCAEAKTTVIRFWFGSSFVVTLFPT